MKHAMQPNQKLTVSSVVDVEQRSWLPRHVRGDQARLSKRVEEAYRRSNYRFLYCRKRPCARCDDLFQEAFLRSRMAALRYQPQRQLVPWIYTLAANTGCNSSRSNLVTRGAMPEHDAGLNNCTHDWPERHAIVQRHERAFAPLPRARAEVRILATIPDGTRQSDIADILKLPLNTIRTHLHRVCQKKLSETLLRRETRRMPGNRE